MLDDLPVDRDHGRNHHAVNIAKLPELLRP
jgi:hypothetical protein